MTDRFSSDTHYGHKRIIEYSKRPFSSLEEMNAEMIKRWNSVVKPGDTTYHLGDFAFASKAGIAELRRQLNGRIVLVRGNHDRSATVMRECGFDEVHDRYSYETRYGGVELVLHLAHKPQPEDQWCEDATLQLCGHVHEAWRVQKSTLTCIVNVGVDQWNFVPQELGALLRAAETCR